MPGLSTRQPNSEIQDMILTVTKSEKIKNSWKMSSCVFNMMGITFHYTAIHQKQKQTNKKTLFSCTLKYTFNWTTAEQIEMGHHQHDQWNGVLKMYRCMLWHVCIHIICNANGHKCAFIYTREMLIYHSWKNTEMPKIVEVHCGHARYFAERR